MSNAWCDKKMPRLVLGDEMIDGWIDGLVSTVERNSNVTATGGIQARVGPNGIALSLVGGGTLALAKSKTGGVPAMSGTTPGKADVTLWDYDGDVIATQAVDVEAVNMGSDAVDENKLLILGRMEKYWLVLWEVCPA